VMMPGLLLLRGEKEGEGVRVRQKKRARERERGRERDRERERLWRERLDIRKRGRKANRKGS